MERKPLLIKLSPKIDSPQEENKPRPLVLKNKEEGARTPVRLFMPRPFPYESNKAVPWRYGESSPIKEEITNIAGIGGTTRSGRIYSPKDTQENVLQNKGKNKKTEEEKENKESKEETEELLQFIRQSEYSIIDQLNRTPAKITLLSLIMSSEPHRNALLKVLSEAHVPHTISQEKVERIVGHITASDHLTFTEEELPLEGSNHNKPLHISIKCKEYLIAKVLVDNGSSLNVMPKCTLDKLTIQGTRLRPSSTIVRAFDGSKREVVGEVNLPIQVGPTIFNVDFHVMDITPAYSCLLGRPWIHDAKAVPSTLHQKVKFIVDDKLVTVQAEDDILISGPSTQPYVDAAEEALETSFQALEIASIERLPRNTKVARMMLKHGYHPGQGLGADSQGMREPPEFKDNPCKYGLGYDPTKGRAERRKGKSPLRTLKQIFRSGGVQASRATLVIRKSFSLFKGCKPHDC